VRNYDCGNYYQSFIFSYKNEQDSRINLAIPLETTTLASDFLVRKIKAGLSFQPSGGGFLAPYQTPDNTKS